MNGERGAADVTASRAWAHPYPSLPPLRRRLITIARGKERVYTGRNGTAHLDFHLAGREAEYISALPKGGTHYTSSLFFAARRRERELSASFYIRRWEMLVGILRGFSFWRVFGELCRRGAVFLSIDGHDLLCILYCFVAFFFERDVIIQAMDYLIRHQEYIPLIYLFMLASPYIYI